MLVLLSCVFDPWFPSGDEKSGFLTPYAFADAGDTVSRQPNLAVP